ASRTGRKGVSLFAIANCARRERSRRRSAGAGDSSAVVRYDNSVRSARKGQGLAVSGGGRGCELSNRSRNALLVERLRTLPGRTAQRNAIKSADPHAGVLVRMVAVSPADESLHRKQHAVLGWGADSRATSRIVASALSTTLAAFLAVSLSAQSGVPSGAGGRVWETLMQKPLPEDVA